MRVFVTGATGFVGSAVVKDLIAHGHQVWGMARSDAGTTALMAAGADVIRGDMENLESLRIGAAKADGVIHCAFNHDFSKFAENCEQDRVAIQTLGRVLEGSGRALIVTSGLAVRAQGRLANEDDEPTPPSAQMPRASEVTAEKFVSSGVRVISLRLPQVHDTTKHGLVTWLIAAAREKGVSAYVGEGRNRWSAVHVLDAAQVYRLALEHNAAPEEAAEGSPRNGGAQGIRYHAVAEEGVPLRDIAETIGRGLKVPVVSKSPEQAMAHFGWMGGFFGRDLAGSSALTRQRLNWHPSGPDMLSDLAAHFA
jgi:nucleoside-diphosphate-sugar epimerase